MSGRLGLGGFTRTAVQSDVAGVLTEAGDTLAVVFTVAVKVVGAVAETGDTIAAAFDNASTGIAGTNIGVYYQQT